MSRRRLVTAVTFLTLAGPAPALAQSAGDEEYQNPLPAPEPAETQPPPAASEAPAAAQTAPEPAAPAAAPAQAPGELPRTGLPVGLVGGAGVVLFAGGAALRRRI